MGPNESIVSIIQKIVNIETRFNVKRTGIVSDRDDPEGRGRILVHIPSLGWNTDAEGAWCFPIDKSGLITPAKGEAVIVEFLDGDKNTPIITGLDHRIKGATPGSYDKKATTQILFEDVAGEVVVKYDESAKVLSIVDGNGNTITLDSGGVKIDLTGSNLGITINDGHGNSLVTGSSGIQIDGASVDLNGNSKEFVTFAELDLALQLFVTNNNLHTHATPAGPSGPPLPTGSLDIGAAKTNTVKTGG
jgi:hypothetical protein